MQYKSYHTYYDYFLYIKSIQNSGIKEHFNKHLGRIKEQKQDVQDKIKCEWLSALLILVDLPRELQAHILMMHEETIYNALNFKRIFVNGIPCICRNEDKRKGIFIEEKFFARMSSKERDLYKEIHNKHYIHKNYIYKNTKEFVYFYTKWSSLIYHEDINEDQKCGFKCLKNIQLQDECRIKYSVPLSIQIFKNAQWGLTKLFPYIAVPVFFASLSRITEMTATKVINHYSVRENIINQETNKYIEKLGDKFLKHRKSMLNEFKYSSNDMLKIYPARIIFSLVGFFGLYDLVFNYQLHHHPHDLFIIATISFLCACNIIPFEKVPGGVLGCLSLAAIIFIIGSIIYDLLYEKYEPETKDIYFSEIDAYIEKEKNGEIIIL